MARRPLKAADSSSKLNALVDADTAQWAAHLKAAQPPPKIFFSALGTTRAQAGSLENQRKVDYDLNIELAKAAKEAGVEVYVLISASGISAKSPIPYSRLKAEIEEGVEAVGFKHTVLVRPGMIVGDREESRPVEAAFRTLAKGMGAVSGGLLKDFWAQDADVIAKAAVSAGLKCLNGEAPPGNVWILQQADIVKLGKTEWKHGGR